MRPSEPVPESAPLDVPALAARFERLPFTRYQKKLVAILATCYTVDAIDMIILSYLLAPISADLHLGQGASGLAAGAGFAGMGVGATVAGMLGDRFGRKRVLVVSMVVWGLANLATAFAWDLTSFVTLRVITGLGMGAELPVAFALLAEFMPAARRSAMTGWMIAISIPAIAAFNGLSLLAVTAVGPAAGWRVMFGVMFVLASFVFVARRGLPESPRWYAARGDPDRADTAMRAIEHEVEQAAGVPLPAPTAHPPGAGPAEPAPAGRLRELFAHGYGRRTLLAWFLWLVVLFAYYGISSWVGKLLVDRGMSVSDSILIGSVITLGGLPGAWAAGRAAERGGRKPVMILALVLVAGAAYGYGHATSVPLVVLAGLVMQFALIAVATVLYVYTPELFPTRARGTGMGTASTAGRVAAISGPLAVPVMVGAWGYTGPFAIFAGCFAAGAVLVLLLGPETRGRTLEDVSG